MDRESSYKASVYRQMLKEVLIEWRALAKRSGIDLENDPGPDGIKYRHFREAIGWN